MGARAHPAPEGMIFSMTMYLYENKVGIFGTKIESEDFYQTQKNLFDVLWEQGRVGQQKRM